MRYAQRIPERTDGVAPARSTRRKTRFRISRVSKHELTILIPSHATLKVWSHPVVTRDFLHHAAKLGNHLRTPSMAVELEGRGLLTAWVEGSPLSQFTLEERVFHVRTILARLAVAAGATRTTDDADFLLEVATKGDPAITASSMFRELMRSAEVSALRGAPLALQHGDVKPANVIIGHDDDALVIDWSPELFGLRPFWADAVQIAATSGEGLLHSGVFEPDLRLVWEAAGFPLPRALSASRVAAKAFELALYLRYWRRDHSGSVASRLIGKPDDFLPKPHKVRAAVERRRLFP